MARQPTLSDKQHRSRVHEVNRRTVKKRNALYASDPAYREFVKGSSRATYRRQAGLQLRNLRNASEYLPQLPTLGAERIIKGGTNRKRLTFSVREMAVALGGYHPNVLRQWIREGRFPAPVLQAHVRGKELVYTIEQTRALMEIMSNHQIDKAYLSQSDAETIAALHEAMQKHAE